MAMIPIRRPQVQPGFSPTAYQQVNINPGAYDTGGAALMQAGQALSSVSDTFDRFAQAQERDDVKKAVAEYDSVQRVKTMGPLPSADAQDGSQAKGYLSLQGQEAIDAYKPHIQALEQERARIRDGLGTGRAQRLFDSSIEGYAASGRQMSDQHLAAQRPVASAQTSDKVMAVYGDTYISFMDQPDISVPAWAAGVAEAGHVAQKNPELGKSSEQNVAEWKSTTHARAVQTLLNLGRVDTAEAYLQGNGDEISEAERKTLMPRLTLARDTQTVTQHIAPLLTKFGDWRQNMGKAVPTSNIKALSTEPGDDQSVSAIAASTSVSPLAATPPAPQAALSPYLQSRHYGLASLTDAEKEYSVLANNMPLRRSKARSA